MEDCGKAFYYGRRRPLDEFPPLSPGLYIGHGDEEDIGNTGIGDMGNWGWDGMGIRIVGVVEIRGM